MKLCRCIVWMLCVTTILVAQGSLRAGEDQFLSRMEADLLRGDWQAVMKHCQACDPNEMARSPILRGIYGHACLALNHNEESILHLLSLTTDPNLPRWGQWATDLVARFPANAVALYLKGDSQARQGSWREAVGTYSMTLRQIDEMRASGKDPDNPRDYRLALRNMDGALVKAMNLNARGVAHACRQETVEALKDLEDACLLTPCFVDAYVNLGAFLVQEEAPEGAMAAFEKALGCAPESPLALVGRGCARYGCRDPENLGKAVHDFASATAYPSVAGLACQNMTQVLDELAGGNAGTSADDAKMSLKTNSELLDDMYKMQQNIAHNERTLQVLPFVPDLRISNVGWDPARIRENTLRNLEQQKEQFADMKRELQNRGFTTVERGLRTRDIENEQADRGHWRVTTWFGLFPGMSLSDVTGSDALSWDEEK